MRTQKVRVNDKVVSLPMPLGPIVRVESSMSGTNDRLTLIRTPQADDWRGTTVIFTEQERAALRAHFSDELRALITAEVKADIIERLGLS